MIHFGVAVYMLHILEPVGYLSLWWMTSGHSSSAINGKSMHGLLL